MSSTYLTSEDLDMIDRLVAEVRESQPVRNIARETAAARFLVQDFEENQTPEPELRRKLAAYLDEQDAMDAALVRWDEGDEPGRSPRSEAQRHIDDDTDGRRRRAIETKNRNQLI